jgi:hypothetical protein
MWDVYVHDDLAAWGRELDTAFEVIWTTDWQQHAPTGIGEPTGLASQWGQFRASFSAERLAGWRDIVAMTRVPGRILPVWRLMEQPVVAQTERGVCAMSSRRLSATVRWWLRKGVVAGIAVASCAASGGIASARSRGPFLDRFQTVTSLASTVPANGDVNPYGIVVVPRSVGNLTRGDLLISNFNNSANLQGTGTTIDEITPGGTVKLFASINPATLPGPCPGGVGLTTALGALRSGFVVVGSLPTSDGMSQTAQAGCLLVLDSTGKVVETIAGGPINGPWDMTAADHGSSATLFVTNVLNGTVAANGGTVDQGTVVRVRLRTRHGSIPVPTAIDVIATGFSERTDPMALVVGPTGVALAAGNGERDHGKHRPSHGGDGGTLYVADTVNSRIAAIPGALDRRTPFPGGGETVSSGQALNGPLGLVLAPGGDVITANGGDGNLVETTPSGDQVASKTVDPAGSGILFGLAASDHTGVYFVDDGDNTLRLLH